MAFRLAGFNEPWPRDGSPDPSGPISLALEAGRAVRAAYSGLHGAMARPATGKACTRMASAGSLASSSGQRRGNPCTPAAATPAAQGRCLCLEIDPRTGGHRKPQIDVQIHAANVPPEARMTQAEIDVSDRVFHATRRGSKYNNVPTAQSGTPAGTASRTRCNGTTLETSRGIKVEMSMPCTSNFARRR
jgi:hypothetical protein